jgi:predicted RNA-binding protein with EMAP domain
MISTQNIFKIKEKLLKKIQKEKTKKKKWKHKYLDMWETNNKLCNKVIELREIIRSRTND